MGRILAAPYIALLKRAVKSGYNNYLIMKDRMFINCYDPDIDSDHGMHYIQMVPDTADYEDKFYDKTMLINPTTILHAYTDKASELTEKRKEKKLKPKEAAVYLSYNTVDGYVKLVFEYELQGSVIDTSSVCIKELSQYDREVELMVHTFDQLVNRLDLSYPTVRIDGVDSGFVEKALNSVRVYYEKLKLEDETIKIPLIKSMLNGNKSFDKFDVTINHTVLKNIYAFMIDYETKGIEEIFWGYIQNF